MDISLHPHPVVSSTEINPSSPRTQPQAPPAPSRILEKHATSSAIGEMPDHAPCPSMPAEANASAPVQDLQGHQSAGHQLMLPEASLHHRLTRAACILAAGAARAALSLTSGPLSSLAAVEMALKPV